MMVRARPSPPFKRQMRWPFGIKEVTVFPLSLPKLHQV